MFRGGEGERAKEWDDLAIRSGRCHDRGKASIPSSPMS